MQISKLWMPALVAALMIPVSGTLSGCGMQDPEAMPPTVEKPGENVHQTAGHAEFNGPSEGAPADDGHGHPPGAHGDAASGDGHAPASNAPDAHAAGNTPPDSAADPASGGANAHAPAANVPSENIVGGNSPAHAAGNTPAAAPGAKPAQAGRTAVIETSMGTIRVELYPDKAPITVKNFLDYVAKGHYNGTIFHRVIPGFMIQGGGMTPDMAEKPTSAPIKNEASNGLKNDRGTLAMARTGDPDSATSQFFINVVDNETLNRPNPDGHGYAVFGKVTQGMDVVDKIVNVPTTTKGPHENVPASSVTIKSIKVQ